MRILIASQNYHPAYAFGGRVMTAVALAEGLRRLGHSVSVATTTVVGRDRRPARRTWTETINGVRVHYLGTLAAIGRTSVNPSVLPFAASHVAAQDAALIIGLYDSLGPALGWFARRSGVPYAIEPSGMLIPIVRSLAAKRLYQRFFGRRLVSHARAVVVTSQREWDDAVRFGVAPRHLVLRRNGVDVGAFRRPAKQGAFRGRLGVPAGEPLILWVGRIEPIKNLDQLLVALAGLTHVQWHLALVGPTEKQEYLFRLQALARELGVAPRTHFVGPLYGDAKLAAFADAHVLALVSFNENWGNVVLEAMAAGVPVLVTDSCGVSELVERGGGLVVKREVAAIRAGLWRLLTDGGLYQRLRADLAGQAENFSWDEPVKQMSNLFASWKTKGKLAGA